MIMGIGSEQRVDLMLNFHQEDEEFIQKVALGRLC